MPLNKYEGWTVAELLRERKRVQMARFRFIERGGSGGADAEASERTLDELDRILEDIAYALYATDPTNYPLTNKRVTRTRVRMYQGPNAYLPGG